jgi:hypothetical protein
MRPKALLTKHVATNARIDVERRRCAGTYLTMISTTQRPQLHTYQLTGLLREFADRFVREGGEWKFRTARTIR